MPILKKKFKEKAHIGIPQENLTTRKLGFLIDHTAPLGSYIFVFTLDIWEFNIVQSCHIISVMFHWIITWSPTSEPYLGANSFGMVWEQDQECFNCMQTNLKSNQRSFKSQAFGLLIQLRMLMRSSKHDGGFRPQETIGGSIAWA